MVFFSSSASFRRIWLLLFSFCFWHGSLSGAETFVRNANDFYFPNFDSTFSAGEHHAKITPTVSGGVNYFTFNFALTDGDSSFLLVGSTRYYYPSTGLGSANASEYYWNGSSWGTLTTVPFPGLSVVAPYKAIMDGFEAYRTANSLSWAANSFEAYLLQYEPASPDGAGGGGSAGPSGDDVPELDWDDNVPDSEMDTPTYTLAQALADGLIDSTTYNALIAAGWRSTDFMYYYHSGSGQQNIVLSRYNALTGTYQNSWLYNIGDGWVGIGSQPYRPGGDGGIVPGGSFIPAPPPSTGSTGSNGNTQTPVENAPDTTPGADDSEELNRINENIIDLNNTNESGFNKLLEQGEDTQDLLVTLDEDLVNKLNQLHVDARDLNNLIAQGNGKTDESNGLLFAILQELEEIQENTEDIGEGGGGGSGPLPPYGTGDDVPFTDTTAQKTRAEDVRDVLLDDFNDLPTLTATPQNIPFNLTLTLPGGPQTFNVLPDDTALGWSLWETARLFVRSFILLIAIWRFKGSIITTLRTA